MILAEADIRWRIAAEIIRQKEQTRPAPEQGTRLSAIILIHIHTLAHSDEHWAGVHSSGLECIYLVKIFY